MSTSRKRMRSLFILFLTIMISSCASMEIQTMGPALTGDEIKKLIDGNTVQGPMGRDMYDWYYQSDGQVTGVVGASDDDSGTWEIKDSKVYCHEWDQYFDGEKLCYEWYRQKRSGRYLLKSVDADHTGSIEVWEIRKGNPYDM